MESNHLSPRLKSNYITTLVLSYLSSHNKITKLLPILSKKGKAFLQHNRDQLRHFCQSYKKVDLHINLDSAVYYNLS